MKMRERDPHWPISIPTENLRRYAEAALAPATRRAYQGDLERYAAWCSAHAAVPAAPQSVASYIAELAVSGRRTSTVLRSLSAISKAATVSGHPSPRAHPSVRAVAAGIRRLHGTASKQAHALTPGELRAMISAMPAGPSWQLRRARNAALLLVGFAGALRRSEIAALRLQDVDRNERGYTVSIQRSKTDQVGEGQKVPIPFGGREESCPVYALDRYRAIRGGTKCDSLFLATSPDGRSFVSRGIGGRQVDNVVRGAARRAGVQGRVSGHSLRAGLATAAARAGKPLHKIMTQTRHKTVAMLMRYVRDAEAWRDCAASGIGM